MLLFFRFTLHLKLILGNSVFHLKSANEILLKQTKMSNANITGRSRNGTSNVFK